MLNGEGCTNSDELPCNCHDGIREFIKTLAGLHELIRLRRLAHEVGVKLDTFVVLRRFNLVWNGSVDINAQILDQAGLMVLGTTFPELPDVVTYDELNQHVDDHRNQWPGLGYPNPDWRYEATDWVRLAPVEAVCPVCYRGWTIDDCEQCVHFQSVEPLLNAHYHPRCFADSIEGAITYQLRVYLDAAGFDTNKSPLRLDSSIRTTKMSQSRRFSLPGGDIGFGFLPTEHFIYWRDGMSITCPPGLDSSRWRPGQFQYLSGDEAVACLRQIRLKCPG